MEKYIYNSLKNDILTLFASIRHPELENLYIKLAEETELQPTQEIFSKWLSGNKKIRSLLSNTSVYDAFLLLLDLRSRYPGGISHSELIKEFMNRGSSGQSTLISFANYLSNPDVKSILEPFSDILVTTTKFMKSVEQRDILGDLKIIKNQFEEYLRKGSEKTKPLDKKRSIHQKRNDMYRYLLNRFSIELANAANSVNLPDLAEKFNSGMLSKPIPIGLGRYIEFNPISVDNARTAKIMAEHVWKYCDSQWNNYNHDIIELTFLSKVGSISKEDFYRLRIEYEQNVNKEAGDGMNIENIVIDKRLDSNYIYMLSMLFVFLESKLGIPGMLS